MADQIVACPGCGKKFKIPDGAAPTGSFPCTACAKDVPWGKSMGPRPQGRAAPAAQPAKAAPAKAAPAKSAAREPQAPVRQAAAAKGRRSRDDADEPRQKGPAGKGPKEEKLSGGMLAMMIGVVLLVIIIVVVNSGKSADPDPVVSKPATPATTQPAAPAAQDPAAGSPAAKVPTSPSPGAAPAAGGDGTGESSGIGGTRNETKSSYGQWYRAPDLFESFDSVDGVTPEERAKFDADAALFANPDAGREASVAGSRLKKAGKKAVPSILSQFGKHWSAGKWATDAEKQSSFQLQSLLKEMVKASDPTKGFVARWTRGVEVAPSEFEKAARIWCAWWRSEGKDLAEFKPYAE